jgi:hypothetical protein
MVPLRTELQFAGTSHYTTESSSCQAALVTRYSTRLIRLSLLLSLMLSAPGIACAWHCHLQVQRCTVHDCVADRIMVQFVLVITGSMMWWATHIAPSNSPSASPSVQQRSHCLPGSPSCENFARAPALWRTICPLVRLLRAYSHVSCWTDLCCSWPMHLFSHS